MNNELKEWYIKRKQAHHRITGNWNDRPQKLPQNLHGRRNGIFRYSHLMHVNVHGIFSHYIQNVRCERIQCDTPVADTCWLSVCHFDVCVCLCGGIFAKNPTGLYQQQKKSLCGCMEQRKLCCHLAHPSRTKMTFLSFCFASPFPLPSLCVNLICTSTYVLA